ncbi:hypothetical protein BAE44_0025526 [Dichanthelium oligosanthes]|uniref:Bromodomain associated domain-containing protein n=1 Tax=Dichanthelium oligosanthes TaxID=888268 RepID=A0A1E5UKQ5_9POAL|nr:hypothetical protein BAE44_0025526 [Dichanthelium oligosanthes]
MPGRLQAAVSTSSTAQILRSSGYSAAEAPALHALSDIAGHYIESLGRAAAALAEAHGRTEPNVADAVLALEEHELGGFPGASDPTRPVVCSGAVVELFGFASAVREVPFAKGLLRRDPGSGLRRRRRAGELRGGGHGAPAEACVRGGCPASRRGGRRSCTITARRRRKTRRTRGKCQRWWPIVMAWRMAGGEPCRRTGRRCCSAWAERWHRRRHVAPPETSVVPWNDSSKSKKKILQIFN